MKLKKLWILGILNIIFVVIVGFYAVDVVEKGRRYDENMHEHVAVLTFKDRLLNQDEWVLLITGKVISSFEDKVWLEKKRISEEKLIAATRNYEEAKSQASYVIYLIIGLFVLTILLYAGSEKLILALGGSMVSTSLILLYIGIYSPMLEIHAYDEDLKIPLVIKFDQMAEWGDDYINKGSSYIEELSDMIGYKMDIPDVSPLAFLIDGYQYDHSIVFEGRMYYYYQSKSVNTIIELLFKDKNYGVAWAILAFSIIFPLIKIFITLLLVYIPKVRKMPVFAIVLSIIGKWSMADIFVAATFLAYFSFHNMNVGIQTESQALIGMDFFLGYAIVSILASVMVWAATKKETKLKFYEAVV